MKKDKETLELPGPPKPRGRPPTGHALNNAERQRLYRQRQTSERMEATIRELAEQFDLSITEVKRRLVRFALCNRNWKQTGF
jgi:hypothetical protein